MTQVIEGQNTLAHEKTQVSPNICDEVIFIVGDELKIYYIVNVSTDISETSDH